MAIRSQEQEANIKKQKHLWEFVWKKLKGDSGDKVVPAVNQCRGKDNSNC
jgi:hypothetical protein